jgi:hypothetical protein
LFQIFIEKIAFSFLSIKNLSPSSMYFRMHLKSFYLNYIDAITAQIVICVVALLLFPIIIWFMCMYLFSQGLNISGRWTLVVFPLVRFPRLSN